MGLKRVFVVMVLGIGIGLPTAAAAADEPAPPAKPGPEDRCAVCGMFVAKYPNWVATVVMKDGERFYFDGPKDMFKFLHDLEKHRRRPEEVAAVWVTDYYTVRPVSAEKALFIIGSDVMGPMGAELVPVAGTEQAHGFAADHGGEAVLGFDEVGPEQISR